MDKEQRKHFLARIDQIEREQIAKIDNTMPEFKAGNAPEPMTLGEAIIAGKVKLFDVSTVRMNIKRDGEKIRRRRNNYENDVAIEMLYDVSAWEKLCAAQDKAESDFAAHEQERKAKHEAPFTLKKATIRREAMKVRDSIILGDNADALKALRDFEAKSF